MPGATTPCTTNGVRLGSPPVANGAYLGPRSLDSEKRPCSSVSTTYGGMRSLPWARCFPLKNETTAPAPGKTSLPPGFRPVCTMYAAVSCALMPCVRLRMTEYLSACPARSGNSSQRARPSTVVAMGLPSGP